MASRGIHEIENIFIFWTTVKHPYTCGSRVDLLLESDFHATFCLNCLRGNEVLINYHKDAMSRLILKKNKLKIDGVGEPYFFQFLEIFNFFKFNNCNISHYNAQRSNGLDVFITL